VEGSDSARNTLSSLPRLPTSATSTRSNSLLKRSLWVPGLVVQLHGQVSKVLTFSRSSCRSPHSRMTIQSQRQIDFNYRSRATTALEAPDSVSDVRLRLTRSLRIG
jgi:hypothetical protein